MRRSGSGGGRASFGHDYHAGASSPRRHPVSEYALAELVAHLVDVYELHDGGAFAARHYEGVNLIELLWQANFAHFRAERFKRGAMFGEIALNRQYAYGGMDMASVVGRAGIHPHPNPLPEGEGILGRSYQPLTDRRSDSGILETSRPGMASPSPLETSAIIVGSW